MRKITEAVERFLGFENFHRIFTPLFSKMAVPLYAITWKNAFRWEGDQQQVFDEFVFLFTSLPVLAIPTHERHCILGTDASNLAIYGELCQVQGGRKRTIGYANAVLSSEQRGYYTTRKELLTLVSFTRQLRHYLLGQQFKCPN